MPTRRRIGAPSVSSLTGRRATWSRPSTTDRRPPLGAAVVELERGERRTVDSVAAGIRSHEHQAVAGAFGPSPHELIGSHEADAHRVDQRVVHIAILEIDLTADGWDSDAVAVTAYAGDNAFDVSPRFLGRTKTQRVEKSDGSRAHGDHVADDSADTGRCSLVRLDGRRVVVRLDLENDGPPLADADRASVLTRALHHGWSGGRKTAEQRLRALVRAMLRPTNAEHAELDFVRCSFELPDDCPVLIRSERNLDELAFVHRFHTQDISTFSALSATERNSFRPSVPPSSASEQRSA